MMWGISILLKSPKFLVGFLLLVSLLLFVFIYPRINTADPLEMVAMSFDTPSKELPLGADTFGRNVFLELTYGTQTSLYIGMVAGLIATGIGVLSGLFAGYKGGLFDNIITTITDLFLVIPSFVILILISVSLGSRSATIIAVIIGITSWPWTTRAVRAQTASLRARDYINIAKISGYSDLKIMVKEVLPYIASYVFMAFSLQLASGILQEAAISMLGLGPFNTVSLGIMLNWAMMFEAPAAGAWWAFVPTTMIISAITFSLYMMNAGMDEIFNPKIRS
jgi:peptide/nickel transport system permease protein